MKKFTKNDEKYMKVALQEAKRGYLKGDYPVGAVLVAENTIIAKGNNSLESGSKGINHAETNILMKYSKTITLKKKNKEPVTLYTTLEPCLMCLGIAVLHDVSRIVYAAQDPDGGAVNLIKTNKKGYYKRKWPQIDGGLFAEESKDLIIKFLKKQTSQGWISVLKTMTKK